MILKGMVKGLLVFLVIQVGAFSALYLIEDTPIESNNLIQVKKVRQVQPFVKKEDFRPLIQQISYTPKVKKSKNPFKVVSPKNPEDIVSLSNQQVQPILYTNTVPLATLSIQKKKETFINMLLPSILLAKYKMQLERKKLIKLSQQDSWTDEERTWLKQKRKEFKAKDYTELYNKMEMHPTSLIIAQAIVESGWGTSKFFQKANNVFGVWSFNKNENRIVASEKRGKKRIYLRKYETIVESIHDYFLTISTVTHYQDFREKRLETQDPFVLVEHLGKYSELGKEYIANIKNIIRINHLQEYDNYKLAL